MFLCDHAFGAVPAQEHLKKKKERMDARGSWGCATKETQLVAIRRVSEWVNRYLWSLGHF